jgi:methylmalonyl-CoA mutase N-terminal domain/subunit
MSEHHNNEEIVARQYQWPNDIFTEDIARGTYSYPPGPSMRLITDVFAYAEKYLPRWNTMRISGYHIREAGATAVQEVAFTLANGMRRWNALPPSERLPFPCVRCSRSIKKVVCWPLGKTR